MKENPRYNVVSVRVSDEERELLIQLRRRTLKSTSEIMREALLQVALKREVLNTVVEQREHERIGRESMLEKNPSARVVPPSLCDSRGRASAPVFSQKSTVGKNDKSGEVAHGEELKARSTAIHKTKRVVSSMLVTRR